MIDRKLCGTVNYFTSVPFPLSFLFFFKPGALFLHDWNVPLGYTAIVWVT